MKGSKVNRLNNVWPSIGQHLFLTSRLLINISSMIHSNTYMRGKSQDNIIRISELVKSTFPLMLVGRKPMTISDNVIILYGRSSPKEKKMGNSFLYIVSWLEVSKWRGKSPSRLLKVL